MVTISFSSVCFMCFFLWLLLRLFFYITCFEQSDFDVLWCSFIFYLFMFLCFLFVCLIFLELLVSVCWKFQPIISLKIFCFPFSISFLTHYIYIYIRPLEVVPYLILFISLKINKYRLSLFVWIVSFVIYSNLLILL